MSTGGRGADADAHAPEVLPQWEMVSGEKKWLKRESECNVKNQVAYVWRFRGPTWLGAHSGDSRFCDFAYLTWFWRGHFLNFAYLTWFWRGQKCDFCSGGFWGAKTNLGRLWGAQMVQQWVKMEPRWAMMVQRGAKMEPRWAMMEPN